VSETSLIQVTVPSWRSLVDLLTICIVSCSVFRLTRLIRALRIAGLLGFVYGAGIVAWHLDLPVTARVLQAWAVVLLCLVAVVFQPEIRRSLMKVDAFSLFGRTFASGAESRNQALAAASFLMARDKTGALMIVVNGMAVDDLTDGGFDLNADISVALIRSLFQKQSPVHDGAVLIRGRCPAAHRQDGCPGVFRDPAPSRDGDYREKRCARGGCV
jgi:diadenylate cyclase